MAKSTARLFIALTVVLAFAGSGQARDLVYTPISPSFGGNPLNTTHLFGLANAQKAKTAPESVSPTTPGGSIGDTNTAEQNFQLFVSQLQGRLLSALATQVTDAIFGQNAQNSGTITFGDQQISFVRTLSSIELTLTNLTTGTSTVISVPQLVLN